jgi:hypothetical protein
MSKNNSNNHHSLRIRILMQEVGLIYMIIPLSRILLIYLDKGVKKMALTPSYICLLALLVSHDN